ncbi:helix-turn-helix domain-containing protein [Marinomonas sp. A79]|uniref:Helix-turn-helix domain-containing protein n=1 Tax=Marinomonas vulgaris TaxID=2823372 RepID=A0ABS5HAY5_9GAMM|nr:AraC family transcriptional regulator [Marinomonas vulgaris]MBR7888800.1 helix-turn-helix domain-containing protein [Marinomonas vulgaris]
MLTNGGVMQSEIRRSVIATQQGEHLHEYSQILIGWQGRMTCELPHSARALTRGQFALAPNDIPHLFSGHSQECELLVVDMHKKDPLMTYISESSGVSAEVLLSSTPAFSQLPVELMGCLAFTAQRLIGASEQVRRRVSTQMLPMVLLQISDILSEQDKTWRSVAHQRLEPQVLNDLIDAKPEQTLSNSWLAHYFNMSESHFYVVCQKQFGMSPQKYLLTRKLQQAQQCLQTTSIPIALVAEKYGFSSTSAFSRAYKKHMGVSPSKAKM